MKILPHLVRHDNCCYAVMSCAVLCVFQLVPHIISCRKGRGPLGSLPKKLTLKNTFVSDGANSIHLFLCVNNTGYDTQKGKR